MTKKEESTSGIPEGEELVKKQAQEMTAFAAEMAADADAGFEEADSNAYAIPFLYILQSGSPQCKRSDGQYVKGAEEGMFFDTVTKRTFDGSKGVIVIPCHYTQRFIEWTPRETGGGGFVGEHDASVMAQTRKDAKGRDALPNGNIIVDTRNHYVLMLEEDGSLTPILITMASTQQRKSKQWMAMMKGFKIRNPANGHFVTAPMMSRMYKLTTVPESNDKGSWFGWNIELAGLVLEASQYMEAKALHNAVKSGAVKEKYDQEAQQASESSRSEEAF